MKIYTGNEIHGYLKTLKNRRLFDSDSLHETVSSIIREVRVNGDKAVFAFTKKLDGADLHSLRVPEDKLKAAETALTPEIRTNLLQAAENIREFHRHQVEKTWLVEKEDDILLGQKITPIERVGVYVPGGKAFYPSSLLMNVIPAQVAGCNEIAVVTPVSRTGEVNPVVLGTCALLGITEVYSIGGAQAVAALAFGTESIPPVDMIVGPGNQYVAKAKQLVFGFVKIDSIAGPSEVTIIADSSADPEHLAIDLFSQAEHDEEAAVTLITPDSELAEKVLQVIPTLLEKQPRKEIIAASLAKYGGILVTENLDEAFILANQIAPEHLELATEQPLEHLDKIQHAGAVFLGHFSPEAVGDYFAGPNHVLPTCGTARFFSPLGVYDFIKRTSIIQYSETAIRKHGKAISSLADLEQLTAHGDSIRIRGKG
ncbi:MAG: histidinol dehydrogenase [Bacteroidetes bacterium]|nr:histidinol dehydrogenase [Bacteroidota bacterium]